MHVGVDGQHLGVLPREADHAGRQEDEVAGTI
jgi:hypothetical protein